MNEEDSENASKIQEHNSSLDQSETSTGDQPNNASTSSTNHQYPSQNSHGESDTLRSQGSIRSTGQSSVRSDQRLYGSAGPSYAQGGSWIAIPQTAEQLGTFISNLEAVITHLAGGGLLEDENTLNHFIYQHHYVLEYTKNYCEMVLVSEEDSPAVQPKAIQRLRLYLTRLQMAQCHAASYLGSLWYSLPDPKVFQFQTRIQFLSFEQRRKECVTNLEEKIQEINKYMKQLTGRMKKQDQARFNQNQVRSISPAASSGIYPNISGTNNQQVYGHTDSPGGSAAGSIPRGFSPSLSSQTPYHNYQNSSIRSGHSSNRHQDLLPMLTPNKNYVSSSNYPIGSPSNHATMPLLPQVGRYPAPSTNHNQERATESREDCCLCCGLKTTDSSCKFWRGFKCSKQKFGAFLGLIAIIVCICLLILVVWVLSNHTEGVEINY